MQTSGILLLFCTSAYWLHTETAPTRTMEHKKIIKEIDNLILPEINENISLPFNSEEKQCVQKNLEIFMNAAQTIIEKHKDAGEAIYNNLKEIQKFSLPGCPPEECDCMEGTFPFNTFKERLASFLRQIQQYVS